MRRLRETLPVAEDGLGLNSYLQIQVMQGDTPFGIRHYWKSHFVDALSDRLIEEIVEHYTRRPPGRELDPDRAAAWPGAASAARRHRLEPARSRLQRERAGALA